MGEVTGRQVFAVTAGAFGVIIAVNVVMAWKAVSTFPGMEVENSYVASQEFDAKRDAQVRLGWTLVPVYEGGVVKLAFKDRTGAPVEVSDLAVLIGRRTAAKDDVRPAFSFIGGQYEANVQLSRGNWMMRVTARAADGTLFEQRADLVVKG